MRCGNFNDIQKQGDGSAVVLEVDSKSYKCTIVGGAPGICSKVQTSIVFLAYGKCIIRY
jgi:hypothetical protein